MNPDSGDHQSKMRGADGAARSPDDYDVVVMGGALAGASTALLLRRKMPDLRILVVELREVFGHKVGEATVEVSGFFLEHVLQLGDHLYREHLPKHGLRYWFAGSAEDTLDTMGEVGPVAPPHVPSFQLDRSKLDEHVLSLAVQAGCEIARPARIKEFTEAWPRSTISLESLPVTESAQDCKGSLGAELGVHCSSTESASTVSPITVSPITDTPITDTAITDTAITDSAGTDCAGTETSRTVTTRWLVDASGRHAFLARRKGLLHRLEEHPTAASWSRWTGVLDLDGRTFMGDPAAPRLKRLRAQRRLATNHFTGRGWWCWVIPLANGKTSVGLVYDKRILDPQLDLGPFGVENRSPELDAEVGDASEGKSRLGARDRYQRFIRAQPGLRELLRDAQMCDDAMTYSFVPYRSSQYMDAGWALVGDAGSFIDPYYSPGLDHVAMSVVATVHILEQDLAGDLPKAQLLEAISAHNRAFAVSYQRWFEALYLDKYEILGDAELVTASFLVETSLYYMGVLTPILRNVDALRNPVFGAPLPQSKIAYQLAKSFRGRIVRLAALRRDNGLYGRRNNSLRMYPKGFGLGARGIASLLRGLRMWCRVEVDQILASLGLIGTARKTRKATAHEDGDRRSSARNAPVGAVPANDGRVR